MAGELKSVNIPKVKVSKVTTSVPSQFTNAIFTTLEDEKEPGLLLDQSLKWLHHAFLQGRYEQLVIDRYPIPGSGYPTGRADIIQSKILPDIFQGKHHLEDEKRLLERVEFILKEKYELSPGNVRKIALNSNGAKDFTYYPKEKFESLKKLYQLAEKKQAGKEKENIKIKTFDIMNEIYRFGRQYQFLLDTNNVKFSTTILDKLTISEIGELAEEQGEKIETNYWTSSGNYTSDDDGDDYSSKDLYACRCGRRAQCSKCYREFCYRDHGSSCSTNWFGDCNYALCDICLRGKSFKCIYKH